MERHRIKLARSRRTRRAGLGLPYRTRELILVPLTECIFNYVCVVVGIVRCLLAPAPKYIDEQTVSSFNDLG